MKREGIFTIDFEPVVSASYGGVAGAICGGIVGMVLPPEFASLSSPSPTNSSSGLIHKALKKKHFFQKVISFF